MGTYTEEQPLEVCADGQPSVRASSVCGERGSIDAVVFAAYGSARRGAFASAISPVFDAVAAAVAPVRCELAYTSAPVIRALARHGETAPAFEGVLGRVAGTVAGHIVVQPGFVADGWAMRDLTDRAEACLGERAIMGAPLLASKADALALADALCTRHPLRPRTALLLVAHGEAWPKDWPHPQGFGTFDALGALRDALAARGRTDAVVTTMRDSDAAVERLSRRPDIDHVTVVPLMLTAGHHAARQLFGDDPASLTSRLAAAGLVVDACDEGLGALPAVRDVYAAHAVALL